MKKDTLKARSQIAGLLFDAADRSDSRQSRDTLRAMAGRIQNEFCDDLPADARQRLLAIAQEAGRFAAPGSENVIRSYDQEVQSLLTRRGPSGGGKGMALFKGLFKKDKDSDIEKAKADVEQAQQIFDQQAALYAHEEAILQSLVNKARQVAPNSVEYQKLKAGAALAKQRMQNCSTLMERAFATIQSNQRYADILAGGVTIEQLRKLMPDPAKADLMIQKISAAADELNDAQELLQDSLDQYGSGTLTGDGAFAGIRDDDFDALVAAGREEDEKQRQENAAILRQAREETARKEQTADALAADSGARDPLTE